MGAAAGYVKATDSPQVTARFDATGDHPPGSLPEGFRLTDRLGSHDLRKINRAL
jgi:hypothetical protein